jgi:hypothetical protein
MTDLSRAREVAALVRLSEDKRDFKFDPNYIESREDHSDTMLRHGVLISESVTPLLEERLSITCKALHVPRENVNAFVYNSSDIQADCLIDTPNTCVLRFSSGLVNLMDEKEFEFVVGHELGHFLLGHGACSQYLSEGSSEDYMIRRARELSADRIGFLSIENLDEAIRAIIKTASGLGDKFLRFDVSSFLSQINMISNPSKGESKNSTHPSMLFRCRSLLWFSMSIRSISDVSDRNEKKIREIDSRVIKDLQKFVDGQVRWRRIEIETDITLWKSALLIFHSGAFSTEAQERLSLEMGEEMQNGVKTFFSLYDQDELLEQISIRLEKALSAAYTEFPNSAEEMENVGFEKSYKIVEG